MSNVSRFLKEVKTLDYMITGDPRNETYLAHYGVLGMKWGVRHNPQRAYQKASKKFNKLAKKSDKQLDKAGKYNAKANRTRIGNTHRNAEIARRSYRKGERAAKKASKWMKSMEKEFSKQKAVSIDPAMTKKGDALMERYRMMRVGGM